MTLREILQDKIYIIDFHKCIKPFTIKVPIKILRQCVAKLPKEVWQTYEIRDLGTGKVILCIKAVTCPVWNQKPKTYELYVNNVKQIAEGSVLRYLFDEIEMLYKRQEETMAAREAARRLEIFYKQRDEAYQQIASKIHNTRR